MAHLENSGPHLPLVITLLSVLFNPKAGHCLTFMNKKPSTSVGSFTKMPAPRAVATLARLPADRRLDATEATSDIEATKGNRRECGAAISAASH